MAQKQPKVWATEEKNSRMDQKQQKVWATEGKNSRMAQKEQKRGAAGEKEKQRRNYSEPLPIFTAKHL